MSCQTFQDSEHAALVLDSSVLINLNASGYAHDILGALLGTCKTTTQVKNELQSGAELGHSDIEMLSPLVSNNLISIEELSDQAAETYLDLVSGPTATSLDDGEAATIALAIEKRAFAVLDERKALAMCARRFPSLATMTTTDLLLHETVIRALDEVTLGDAVFGALMTGRMRVPNEYQKSVIALLGAERASQCRSLPRRLRS
jgi:predicted nucleic acid-binding protein